MLKFVISKTIFENHFFLENNIFEIFFQTIFGFKSIIELLDLKFLNQAHSVFELKLKKSLNSKYGLLV